MHRFYRNHPEADPAEIQRKIEREIADHSTFIKFEAFFLIGIGFLALLLPVATAFAVEILIGVLLLVGAVMRLYYGVRFSHNRVWRIFSGLLMLIGGGFLLTWPMSGMGALVITVGILLIAEGVIQVLHAFAMRPCDNWGWLLTSGTLASLLGIFIFAVFPTTGILYIGIAFGVSMIAQGLAMFSLVWHIEQRMKGLADEISDTQGETKEDAV